MALSVYFLSTSLTIPLLSFAPFNVSILELYATFIHVRGLASYKTRFNLPIFTSEMPVPSQEYDRCYPFVLCV